MMETNNTTETFEETTRMVVQRLREEQAAQGNCQHNTSILCLNLSPNPIVRNMTQASSLIEICRQRAPSDYRDFYFPLTTEDTIQCITNCTPNTRSTLDCHFGQCHVTRAGPQCSCYDETLYWYTGDNCSGRISKVAMALGLVATILLIGCVVLTIILVRNYHKKKYKLSDPQTYAGDNWYEADGFTWRSPDGFLYRNMVAAGPTGDDTLSNFTPSLDLVDTSRPMRISRPELRPSSRNIPPVNRRQPNWDNR
ncbi:mucin-3A-like [Columba livia]|uniref:mucin-3A-like n=1 Tax=Columba livia TaxID=8932 RepID=UPI0031BACD5D